MFTTGFGQKPSSGVHVTQTSFAYYISYLLSKHHRLLTYERNISRIVVAPSSGDECDRSDGMTNDFIATVRVVAGSEISD